MLKVKNIEEMVGLIQEDENLRKEIASNPEIAIQDNFKLVPDTPVYRYVVIFLGLTIVLTVIGYFLITLLDKGQLDSAIIALASAAIGALAGLLAPQPT